MKNSKKRRPRVKTLKVIGSSSLKRAFCFGYDRIILREDNNYSKETI